MNLGFIICALIGLLALVTTFVVEFNLVPDPIKDRLKKLTFAASTIGLTALYLLYAKRGRQLSEVTADAQRTLLAQQLADIQERSRISDTEYQNAAKDYESLKNRHSDLMSRLGISHTGGIAPGGDPSQSGH